jgi:hypothetical protein
MLFQLAPYGLQNALSTLESFGIRDVILPFILIFTLVYAVLLKAKILGEKKNFNVVIALVLALAVVIPHVTGTYPAESDVVNIINTALPQISLVLVAIISVMILVGIWGVDSPWANLTGLVVFIALAAVIFIFGSAAGWWPFFGFLSFLSDPDIQALLVIVLVFGLIVWFITREPEKAKGEGVLKSISDLFVKK